MLGIDEILGAEAAADIGRDEAHGSRLDAEAAGGVVSVGVDALAGDVQRVAAGRLIERADRAARLDRVGRDAMIVERQRDDVRRFGERRLGALGVAGAPVHADIARHLGRQKRRAGGDGGLGRRDRGQGLVVDLDQL